MRRELRAGPWWPVVLVNLFRIGMPAVEFSGSYYNIKFFETARV